MIKITKKDLNVPNLLTVLRILLIVPFLVFFFAGNIIGMIVTLVLSGLSDLLDGFIARRFNLITDVGKLLDPIADKLTHVTISFCLAYKVPGFIPLFVLFLLKEGFMIAGGAVMLKKKLRPMAAKWYGKVTTVVFYLTVLAIILEFAFFPESAVMELLSFILLIVTCIAMIFAFIQYARIFSRMMKEDKELKEISPQNETA